MPLSRGIGLKPQPASIPARCAAPSRPAQVKFSSRATLIAAASLLLLVGSPRASDAQDGQGQNAASPGSYAGSANYPDLMKNSMSAEGDLAADQIETRPFLRFETAFGPWLSFKEMLRQNYGLTIGGSYGVLFQNYSDVLSGQDYAFGGKFTLNTSLDLLNRGQPDALAFDMAIEDRRPLGTDQPPLWAGFNTGSATATAATWGEFDLGITQAYIRQSLMDGKFQYTIGRIFAPNYVDAYPFFDDNRQFFNQSFATSPTIPIPLRGFGAVGAVYPVNNLYVEGGIFTPYSSDTGWTVDDFVKRNQYFYSLEVGYSNLAGAGVPLQARGAMNSNNFHATFWYRDALDDGSPRAYGVALNANYLLMPNLMGFARGGVSHGWLIDGNLTLGLGYRPAAAPSDLFGIGVGWAHPEHAALDSQFTGEMFYRWQVTSQLAITPDAQVIINPVRNPGEDVVWALGFRSRLAF